MPSIKEEDSESPERQPATEAELAAGDETSSESGTEVPETAAAEATAAAAASESGPSRPSKKKKKKRSKVARAISALKGDSVPQAVVDQVVAKVKEEHGEDSAAADEDTVRELLKQLKLKDVAEGKAGLGGKNRKDTGDHKVCFYLYGEYIRCRSGGSMANVIGVVLGDATCTSLWCVAYTASVNSINPSFSDDGAPEEDGYIEPSKPTEEVRQDPFPLPKDFEWSVLDITEPAQVWTDLSHPNLMTYPCFSSRRCMNFSQLTTSRMTNLRSGSDIRPSSWSGMLHVDLCPMFVSASDLLIYRALKPPGWHKEWHIGVRVSSNKKLVAFISGVPIHLRVRQK